MSRKKLIKQLKEKNPKLKESDLENILDVFTNCISKALISEKSIEIRGFGRWYHKKLKENFNARNPATNELLYVPERVKVRFRASKKLNRIINE